MARFTATVRRGDHILVMSTQDGYLTTDSGSRQTFITFNSRPQDIDSLNRDLTWNNMLDNESVGRAVAKILSDGMDVGYVFVSAQQISVFYTRPYMNGDVAAVRAWCREIQVSGGSPPVVQQLPQSVPPPQRGIDSPQRGGDPALSQPDYGADMDEPESGDADDREDLDDHEVVPSLLGVTIEDGEAIDEYDPSVVFETVDSPVFRISDRWLAQLADPVSIDSLGLCDLLLDIRVHARGRQRAIVRKMLAQASVGEAVDCVKLQRFLRRLKLQAADATNL